MRSVTPFESFLGGRQMRLDDDYAKSRNALAEQEVANAPAEAMRRNKLADLQIQGAEQRMTQDAQSAKYDAYQQIGSIAQQALQSGNPRQFVSAALSNPAYAQLLQAAGVDPQQIDLNSPTFEKDLQTWAGFGPQVSPDAKYNRDTAMLGIKERGALSAAEAQQRSLDREEDRKLREQLAREANQARIDAANASAGARRDDKAFQRENTLRDEFNQQSKEFVTVGDAYRNVLAGSKDPSAAGDLSMIFAYMKMLDPNSVVRETEFANAQNAAGVPDRVQNLWNKALTGQRLNPEQRADFQKRAEKLYKTQKARNDALKTRYSEMAQRNGLTPDNIIGDMGVSEIDVPTDDIGKLLDKYAPQ